VVAVTLTKPRWQPYAAASVGVAVALLLLYYNYLVAGVISPKVGKIAGLPIVYDEETLFFLAGFVTLSSLPIYLYARKVYSWTQKLREQTRDFLLAFSGLALGTESIYEALVVASRMVGSPLGHLIEYMARLYKVTGDIEKAFNETFRGVPRDVRLLLSTIVLTAKGGGRVEEVIAQAANYANELRRFSILVESRLAQYTAIVALSSITFSFAATVILKLIESFAAAELPFAEIAIPSPEILRASFYYAMLLLTIFSSIVVGKVIRGYLPLAAKYIVILVPVNALILLYLPAFMPS
jgi:hypothetical protein